MTACVSEDINTDPNSAYTTVPGSLVNYAQKELSDYVNTPNVNENNFRLTMQYWQETIYVNESNYDFTNRNVSNQIFRDNYVNVLNNLGKAKEIINVYVPTITEAPGWEVNKKNQLAIIDVMQVYTYQLLVDTFGNIPYTQGANLDKYPLPAYDDAATIYTDLIKRIDNDLTQLDVTGSGFDSFDEGEKIYNGNIPKWIKFANSLKLKLGIAIADSNPALAQATAQSAIAAGVMASPTDNAEFNYIGDSPNFNPIYEAVSTRNDFIGGKTLVDAMNTSNDPRIGKYYTKAADGSGVYKGQVIGLPGSFRVYSRIAGFAYDPTTAGVLLNYTEVAFYLAEADARWGSPATAATAYATAVTASITEWGGSAADATTYLAAHPYDAANWKKSIGEQAWVALYNQALTSWNFWRRLDFPVLLAPASAIANAGGKVPVRMTYPVLEQQVNNTNWKAASDAIGGDLLTTKLFWDKF